MSVPGKMFFACFSLVAGLAGCDALPTEAAIEDPQLALIAVADANYAQGAHGSLSTISPTGAELDVGESMQLRALDATGQTVQVKWSSTNTAVLTVSTDGLAVGRGAGTATVTAQLRSSRVTAAFLVVAGATQPEPEAPVTEPTPPPSSSTDFGAVVRGIRPRGFGAVPYMLTQPAAGSRELHVAQTGDDSAAGTAAAPLRTINRAAQLAVAGDVVTIHPGTYRESVSVRNGGTAGKPIVFQAAERGAVVLTGGQYNFQPAGWSSGVQQEGAVYVTLRGLIFRDYAPQQTDTGYRVRAAVGAIRGWRIEDSLFERAGYNGIDIRGNDVVIERSTFRYTHTNALTAYAPRGSYLDGIRVVDVVLQGNHTRPDPLPASSAEKVSKFLYTRGAVLDNIESYDNNGSGFWFDTENVDYTVRNSYLHDNTGAGLFLEINFAGATIENNVIVGNTGPAVRVANSAGVTVRNNLMARNAQCVTLVNADRGTNADGTPRYPLRDVSITGNRCKDWQSASAVHALSGTFTTPAAMGIDAEGNTYEPVTVTALAWWPNTGGFITSIAGLRERLGWEDTGTVAAITVP